MGIILNQFNPELKNKTLLLASQGCMIRDHCQYLDWRPVFNKIFAKLITFSTRDYYFRYGKDKMNELFLNIIKNEQPDFVLLCMNYDEFDIETLLKIKEISPNTTTIHFFGDDEWRYDDWSRYYAQFFDYCLVTERDISEYKKDHIKNVFSVLGTNPDRFKPLNLEKKYDVVFAGAPIADRPDYIKFLLKNNINIKVFSPGWEKYPEIRPFYGGYLSPEEYPKIMNQAKINLSFSKGFLPGSKKGQVKGRTLDIPACKAFMLVEDTLGLKYYFNDIKKILFTNKKELLEKINYFLRHDSEREKLAESSYKKVTNNYTWELQFKLFFKTAKLKTKKSINIDNFSQKVCYLTKKDLNLRYASLLRKISNYKYISFLDDAYLKTKYKDYFQVYSLEKSGRDISCCDYYISSISLGDYLLFQAKRAFYFLDKKNFDQLITFNQLTITKDYLLKNLDEFKKAADSGIFNLIDKQNTVFVSIPLISIKNLNILDDEFMKKAFQMKFRDNLYSFIYQRKLSSIKYAYDIFYESIQNRNFMVRYLIKSIFNKENLRRLVYSK